MELMYKEDAAKKKTTAKENRLRSISPIGVKIQNLDNSRSPTNRDNYPASPSNQNESALNFTMAMCQTPQKTSINDVSLYDQFQQNKFGTTVGYLMGLNVHNIAQRKKLMVRKLNELDNKNKQKVSHLENLKKELLVFQQHRGKELAMETKVLETVKKRQAEMSSPERVYQQQISDQVLDANALSSAYDFSSAESVFEKKQILKGKLILVD